MFKKIVFIVILSLSYFISAGTVNAEKLKAPKIISVIGSDSEVLIKWEVEDHSKVKGIQVFRDIDSFGSIGSPHDTIDQVTTNSGVYIDSVSVKNGKTYVYRLKSTAKNTNDSNSDLSSEDKAVPFSKELLSGTWSNFQQYGFGVGFITVMYTFMNREAKIEEAIIQEGKVRVTKEKEQDTRLFLEAHAIWKFEEDKSLYHGPMFGIIIDDESNGDAIAGLGIGYQLGFLSKRSDQSTADAISIGIGLIAEDGINTLPKDFKDGEPPPNTVYTEGEKIELNSKSRISPFIFATATF